MDMMNSNILKNRNQADSVHSSSEIGMDSILDTKLNEKENFNPRSLKEIATEKSVNINPVMNDDNTIVMTDETSINDTFPTEPMDHDPNVDEEESYMSTNDSLSFLTDGFNNMKLEGSHGITSTQTEVQENMGLIEAKDLPEAVEFKFPLMPSKRSSTEKFQNGTTYNFGYSDFDFLQKFGTSPVTDANRDSVLLNFDPLLERVKAIDAPTQFFSVTRLSITKEADEELVVNNCLNENQELSLTENSFISPSLLPSLFSSLNENHNVDMKEIELDSKSSESYKETKESESISIISDQQNNEASSSTSTMTETEIQIRKEAELMEEALLKRISEKDKQIAKMSNVVEAYEKAIAELIAEKEQLIQNYEKKCTELKTDSETNSLHLASLESTFSDLHAKYERSKQNASELKEREEVILQDRKTFTENLKVQEMRYEKMKTHAMTQLEIANNKLTEMSRNHQAEITKLKAQLKKEEISRASTNEQLIQKAKENAELVKICDELIGNHGNQPQNA